MPPSRSVPIRDAASLILVREGKTPHVLMGKRSPHHVFMPNKYVFPGGRVDAADSQINAVDALAAPVEARLRRKSRLSARRARALALAAIRETYEETGVILGQAADSIRMPSSRAPAWQDFLAHGAVPRLAQLDFIGRAITPPNRVRRFDTRFFLAYAEDIFARPRQKTRPSGELLQIKWVALADAQNLDLPIITRQMLHLLEARLRLRRARRPSARAWFFRELAGEPHTEEI